MANDLKFRENVLIKELFIQDISRRNSDGLSVDVKKGFVEIYEEYIDKFNEEARMLRQFHNDHIINVRDLFNENNTSYYVMDYVEGELLADKMVRLNKTLSESETLSYLNQLLEGLSAMHSQGFWHLDITPSSIMVNNEGVVKFLEYGHCKLVNNESTIIADQNHDPMELQSNDEANIGPWTDFYALGATLYNLLTGKRPPAASEVNEATKSLYHFPTSVSKKMQRLILWMMSPNIFRRPQDINEVNEFLYGINMTGKEDKTFQKNLNNVSGKSASSVVHNIQNDTEDDDEEDDDDEDGLGNKALKAMQIFLFLAAVGVLGYFAYRMFAGGERQKSKDDTTDLQKKRLKKQKKQKRPKKQRKQKKRKTSKLRMNQQMLRIQTIIIPKTMRM